MIVHSNRIGTTRVSPAPGGRRHRVPEVGPLPGYGQSAFLIGTPTHGSGIVSCAGGAGWPTASRCSDTPCSSSRYSTALNPRTGLGVVVFWQPQVPSISSGQVADVNELPARQLLVDCR